MNKNIPIKYKIKIEFHRWKRKLEALSTCDTYSDWKKWCDVFDVIYNKKIEKEIEKLYKKE